MYIYVHVSVYVYVYINMCLFICICKCIYNKNEVSFEIVPLSITSLCHKCIRCFQISPAKISTSAPNMTSQNIYLRSCIGLHFAITSLCLTTTTTTSTTTTTTSTTTTTTTTNTTTTITTTILSYLVWSASTFFGFSLLNWLIN